MYKGNYNRKRRLRWRKEFVLLCSIAALLVGIVGSTVAYLFTTTDPVENIFTPAKTDIQIEEGFDQHEKTNVKVTNSCDYPVYIRAMVVVNWTDKDGNIVASVPEGYTYTMTGLPGSGWSARNGGYYYYESAVPAGESTEYLLTKCEATTPENPEYFLLVDVLAESIQAEPQQAVIDAWGFVPGASSAGE